MRSCFRVLISEIEVPSGVEPGETARRARRALEDNDPGGLHPALLIRRRPTPPLPLPSDSSRAGPPGDCKPYLLGSGRLALLVAKRLGRKKVWATFDTAVAAAFTDDQCTFMKAIRLPDCIVRRLAAINDEPVRILALGSMSRGERPDAAIACAAVALGRPLCRLCHGVSRLCDEDCPVCGGLGFDLITHSNRTGL